METFRRGSEMIKIPDFWSIIYFLLAFVAVYLSFSMLFEVFNTQGNYCGILDWFQKNCGCYNLEQKINIISTFNEYSSYSGKYIFGIEILIAFLAAYYVINQPLDKRASVLVILLVLLIVSSIIHYVYMQGFENYCLNYCEYTYSKTALDAGLVEGFVKRDYVLFNEIFKEYNKTMYSGCKG